MSTITGSGLIIEELVVGAGTVAVAGESARVHYTGWLANSTKFDSTREHGDPFVFALGAGCVISGWDEGVQGMRVGGRRRLTIPPALAYGTRGVIGMIPPNATLIYEVELLGVG